MTARDQRLTTARTTTVTARRASLAVAGVALVITGLGVATLGVGTGADLLGDALYAALVYVLVGFARPRAGVLTSAAVTLAICTTVELSQLTALPATLVQSWTPLRYLLGTTFNAADLLAYTCGAAATAAVDGRLLRGRAPAPSRATEHSDQEV